jgi:hypothetical protein
MASLKELRYYRGNYNPSQRYRQAGEAYGQMDSSGGDDIFSMYNPDQENQFIDAIAKRQERFDVANLAQQQERVRIGETETYDLAELNNRLKSFETGINETVKSKYNGDYGAAANEIAKMIGTERTNPFYHFNKQKVEMGKAFLDAKMKLGSKFMSANSPFDVSFQDWQKGKTFEFTPINRDDIVKDAAIEFGSIADTIQNDPTFRSTVGGQYFIATMQNGLRDPAAVMEYMKSPDGEQMIQNIIEKNPELAKFNREDLMGAVTEGAYAAIGKTQRQIVADQSYLDDLQQSRIKGSSGGSQGKVVTLGYIGGPVSTTTGKPIKIPVHALNPMYGTTSGEGTEIDKNIKGVDTYLTKLLQKGDIIGVTSEDSKLLKDVETKELISFALVPIATTTGDPCDIILNIMGTPAKTKNNRTPVPVPISTRVFDPNDKVNILTQLSLLDPSVLATYMEQLKEVNPAAHASMVKAINEAKTK